MKWNRKTSEYLNNRKKDFGIYTVPNINVICCVSGAQSMMEALEVRHKLNKFKLEEDLSNLQRRIKEKDMVCSLMILYPQWGYLEWD